jgi:hypothetical protein
VSRVAVEGVTNLNTQTSASFGAQGPGFREITPS